MNLAAIQKLMDLCCVALYMLLVDAASASLKN